MNEIQIIRHEKIRDLVIDEYMSVLDTMEPHISLFLPYSYVPSIYDAVGAFEGYSEDILETILEVYRDHCLFFKFNGHYFNKPFKGVW